MEKLPKFDRFSKENNNKNVRLFKRFNIYHENLDNNERERLLGSYISHNTSKGRKVVCVHISFKQWHFQTSKVI